MEMKYKNVQLCSEKLYSITLYRFKNYVFIFSLSNFSIIIQMGTKKISKKK